MSDVPAGWTETLISEVAEIVGGSTPQTTQPSYWNGDIPWITPDDLSGHDGKFISEGARSITQAGYDSCSTRLVPAGTVLYSSRAPIGYVAIAAVPVCTNQGFKSFVPSASLDSEYLFWYLTHATPSIRRMGSGTTFAEVSGKVAKTIPIRYPPLDEQRRIVEAIEEQVSRLDASEASLRAAERRLPMLASASLSSTFDIDAPIVSIADIAQVGSGATPKRGRSDYYDEGTIPWVTSGQLSDDFVRSPVTLITEKALRETSVKMWPKGTLLMAMYGEGKTRGRCSELLFASTCNQACAAIVLEDGGPADRSYVRLFLKSTYEKNRRLASGGVQPNLSLGLVKGLMLPLPAIEQQRTVVAQVERKLSLVDSLSSAVAMAIARCGSLRRAVLRDAFAGTLVGHDHLDSPSAATPVASDAPTPTSSRRKSKKAAMR